MGTYDVAVNRNKKRRPPQRIVGRGGVGGHAPPPRTRPGVEAPPPRAGPGWNYRYAEPKA